jgi:hypothetical protein
VSERLMRARDVAELLDVTPGTVLDWFEAGRLRGFRLTGRVGSPVRLRESVVLAALESWRPLEPLETEATNSTVIGLVEGYNPTLAIIDAAVGAYPLQRLDDNRRRDVECWGNLWTRPFWQLGVATITLDHVTKSVDNRGRYGIGSERKVGGVDVHLGFVPVKHLSRGGDGHYRIVTHKDRPGHLPPPDSGELELHSDPVTDGIRWSFSPPSGKTGAGDEWRPTWYMDRVLAKVNEPTYEPMARTALAQSVTGTQTYKLQAIDFLIADGLLALDEKKKVVRP